jgi:Ca2+-binding RTX toxin-like protein
MAIINDDDFSNTIGGTAGDDIINGNGGNDILLSDRGADVLNGGGDNDTADYSRGVADVDSSGAFVGVNVSLDATGRGGDAEGDTYISIENVIGTGFADVIAGNDFDNDIFGGSGSDLLKGFGGSDSLQGNGGNDTLFGGQGDDFLNGGAGADTMIGDSGIDTVDYRDSTSNDGVIVDLAFGQGFAGDALGDSYSGIENVFGSLAGDALIGNDAANQLFGDGGNDTLIGGEGNDSLAGQDGADQMIGGNGDDTYVVNSLTDKVSEVSTNGNDTIRTSIDFNLSNSTVVSGDVENLTLTGSSDIDAIGNALNNVLTGNSGDNSLRGGLGADTMRGGAGDDRYNVDNVGDVVDEGVAGSGGIDSVTSTVSFSLSGSKALGSVENLDLLGNGNINAAGNALDNVLEGNGARNDLMGLGGNDELTGGRGADTFVFNAALNETTNVDTITDFNVIDDTIRLENAFMQALGTGPLAASAFHIGATAADASDRIIYDSATGALSYDADGNGAQAAIKFAELDTGLALTSADFLIV